MMQNMDLLRLRKGCERESVLLGWRYRWILLIIMGLAAVMILGCVSYTEPAQPAISYVPLTCLQPMCEEVAVQRGDITLSVQAIGNVRSKREDYVAPARGKVARVAVSAGDKVQKGQVLMGLDPTPLQLAVVQAKMALQDAEGSLENLQQQPTSEASEKAQSLVVDAQSKVDSARKQLELAKGDLTAQELARIKADINVTEAMLQEALRQVEELTHNPTTQSLAEARLARSNAGVALKEAEEALDNLAQDHTRQLFDARRAKAEADVALQTAEQALKDFRGRIHYLRRLDAQRAENKAEDKLEEAEDARSHFLRFRYTTGPFDRDADDQMAKLQEEVELARAELDLARQDLAELDDTEPLFLREDDTKLLFLPKLESAVDLARSDLKVAEESLAYFNKEADPRDIESRQVKLAATKSELKVIQDALAVLDNEDNSSASAVVEPAPRDRALLEAKAAELEADLAMYTSALRAIESGVNPSEVALLETKIAQARNDLGAANEVVDKIESAPSNTPVMVTLQEVQGALNNLQSTLQSTPEGVQQAQLELESVEGKLREVRGSLQGLEGTPNQLNLELRRKQVEVAREDLADAEENLQNATIVAPFDGVVSELNVQRGQRVNAGELMLQLLDYNAPVVVAQVLASNVAQLQEGQQVSFTIGEFSDSILSGRVTRISGIPNIPTPNNHTGANEPTYEVVISSEALQSASLIEGMPASVEITIDQRRDVLVVPTTVLNGNTDYKSEVVQVVNGGGTDPVSITLGLKNKLLVEVKDGLREGDVVRVHRGSTKEMYNSDSVKDLNTNSLVTNPEAR